MQIMQCLFSNLVYPFHLISITIINYIMVVLVDLHIESLLSPMPETRSSTKLRYKYLGYRYSSISTFIATLLEVFSGGIIAKTHVSKFL